MIDGPLAQAIERATPSNEPPSDPVEGEEDAEPPASEPQERGFTVGDLKALIASRFREEAGSVP